MGNKSNKIKRHHNFYNFEKVIPTTNVEADGLNIGQVISYYLIFYSKNHLFNSGFPNLSATGTRYSLLSVPSCFHPKSFIDCKN